MDFHASSGLRPRDLGQRSAATLWLVAVGALAICMKFHDFSTEVKLIGAVRQAKLGQGGRHDVDEDGMNETLCRNPAG